MGRFANTCGSQRTHGSTDAAQVTSRARCATSTCNRRRFLQSGAAVSVLPLLTQAVAWAASAVTPAPRECFYKVIYDPDHQATAAFGRGAQAGGLSVQSVGADITALWYDDLYHRWRKGPIALAGLTTQSAAFCLETLGRDAGMRAVFRAVHQLQPDGTFTHYVRSARARSDAAVLSAGGNDWSLWLVTLLKASLAASLRQTVPLDYLAQLGGPTTLVSWVIAPVVRS